MKKLFIVFFALCLCGTVSSQTIEAKKIIHLLEDDQKAVLENYLQLSEEEAEKFWPLYESYYEFRKQKIDLRRFKLVRKSLESYFSEDESLLHAMVKESIAIDEEELTLRKRFYKIVRKKVNGVVAARFYRFEESAQAALQARLNEAIPLLNRR